MNDTLALAEVLSEKELDYLHVSTMNFFGASLRDAADATPEHNLFMIGGT